MILDQIIKKSIVIIKLMTKVIEFIVIIKFLNFTITNATVYFLQLITHLKIT